MFFDYTTNVVIVKTMKNPLFVINNVFWKSARIHCILSFLNVLSMFTLTVILNNFQTSHNITTTFLKVIKHGCTLLL